MNRTKVDDHVAMAELPTTGSIFQASWPVRTGDIHTDKQLRLDAIARYLQDAGFDNLVDRGAMDTHPLWMVRRTVIDVLQPVVWPDRVHLQRWCSGLSNKWCSMRVRIRSDGGGLIETEAFWINIDPKTGMPASISEKFTAALASTAVDQHLHWRRWIDPTPDTTPSADTPFPLRSSDFDPFDHVNNAIYWQPVEDALPDRLRSGPFRAILEYTQPIKRGEQVSVRTGTNTLHIDAGDEARASARWFALSPKNSDQG
ncbi:acyl-[acyl-carrier-protein] thioesterase [Rhodococcus qingshengii]|uniref:acyl-[acyl-carrier-protein] thioesterase n=1 Tax=Rhodococcus qingshengii TaxID=334542 RepID=UPI001F43562D|nr:acyl-ACP thioesterase domain-containing protein [Rhodococcus qingshengii]